MNQEKRKLKIYIAEFRASSVKLAIDSDLPITQTAKDLGINANTLHTWINKYSQPRDKTRPCAPLGYRVLRPLLKGGCGVD